MHIRRIVKTAIPKSLFTAVEPLGHKLEAIIFNLIKGFPAKKLKFIGVTGTDGKTTTSTMIAQMLRSAGYKVAMITTVSVDYGDGKGEQPSPTGLTTANVPMLLSIIKRIKANDMEWVVLETSSHALAQHRVWGVPYSIAVMTNVSHEHLDYHKTFQRYVAAKTRLFARCSANREGLRVGVINADDPSADKFLAVTKNPITYGQKSGDIRAIHVKLTTAGSRFQIKVSDQAYRIECHIPGSFNVSNALAAVCVGRAIGLDRDQIEQGIASLDSVMGRMERIEADQPFEVIVDYAVTPEALKNVLQTVKQTTTGSVRVIFGATGDRDKSKRPIMGQVAAENADYIYLTDDETHTEDPETIRQAVYAGVVAAGGADKTEVVDDRLQAIKQAISDANPGDTIVITGIGHQKSRNMGGVDQPWDERAIVKELLSKH